MIENALIIIITSISEPSRKRPWWLGGSGELCVWSFFQRLFKPFKVNKTNEEFLHTKLKLTLIF